MIESSAIIELKVEDQYLISPIVLLCSSVLYVYIILHCKQSNDSGVSLHIGQKH